ncbi:MAG: hypothetical protein KAU44_06105 [Candidatus Marinimicrobia bacterium]|nr:hypothetical protein [Candidatus Neomarinimicrobiota bacterium]
MEIGSHYYAVLALCRMLGIKKEVAYKIAYSSEFVDDSLINRIIFKKPPRGVRCHFFGKRRGLDNTATSLPIMTIWTYNQKKIINIFVPFHFVPGCKGSLFDKKMRTFPDSPILKSLTKRAVDSGDPYSIGIILHVLGDAHAHQGFSGLISRRNRVKSLKIARGSVRGFMDTVISWYMTYLEWFFTRVFGRILPLYSHSHVGTVPDIPSAEWSYKYNTGISFLPEFKSTGIIKNRERYIVAFNEMREILTAFIEKYPEFKEDVPEVDSKIFNEELTKVVSRRESIVDWEEFLIRYDLLKDTDTALHYEAHDWIRTAFKDYKRKRYSRPIVWNAQASDDFVHSDWYKYYLAAREYKELYDLQIIKHSVY